MEPREGARATKDNRRTLEVTAGYFCLAFGAGDEIRTRDVNLGKVALYH